MATAAAMNEDTELALSIAQDHNVGDVALGRRPSLRRQQLNNAIQLKMNIEPMELVNRAHPEKNFQFTWVPFGDDDFYQDAKDEGYKPVIESEWINQRWDWVVPDVDKKRWSETSLLVTRNYFLMYRDEELFAREMRNRETQNERSIKANTEQAIVAAQGHGMAVDGEVGGQKFEVPAPTRRKSVS